jgi:hypothetical protein
MKKRTIALLSAYSAVTNGPPDEVHVGDDFIDLRWHDLGLLKFKPAKTAKAKARLRSRLRRKARR